MDGRHATGGVSERMLDSVSPAAWAEVMSTGIVSIALWLDHQETLSRILLVVAATLWLTFAVLVPVRAVLDRVRFLADVRTPAALGSVAAAATLGTGLTTILGWRWAGIALLAIALLLWLALLSPVLRNWKTPTVGASLLLAVSTESLAVLAATLAPSEHAQWLLVCALVLLALGLGFYAVVMSRFDPRQLGTGRGDHWIAGGALAISALAAGKIAAGAKALTVLGGGGGFLKELPVLLWGLAILWLPLLLLAETLRPRLHSDVSRWSTVFPLGMYAASSFVVGAVASSGPITSFARVWVWVAVAAWTVVFVAMVDRAISALAPQPSGLRRGNEHASKHRAA
jgi:tellurite resistance protein TehA-like permease